MFSMKPFNFEEKLAWLADIPVPLVPILDGHLRSTRPSPTLNQSILFVRGGYTIL